jgi:hypothetical protein
MRCLTSPGSDLAVQAEAKAREEFKILETDHLAAVEELKIKRALLETDFEAEEATAAVKRRRVEQQPTTSQEETDEGAAEGHQAVDSQTQ